jgi:hypothetical protein
MEGATGGMLLCRPPVVVAKLQDRDTPKDTPARQPIGGYLLEYFGHGR